ncbi:MAG: signal recognition particle receptor subunit alpha, partial [Pseudothermotoga sp.]
MGFFEKLRSRLMKARKSFFEGLSQLLKGKRISKEILEELEERLIAADVGYETTQYILEKLKQTQTNDAFSSLKKILVELLEGNNEVNVESNKPFVITIVGVNGTGKTTTAAKLAAYFQSLGKTVVLG